MFEAGDVAFVKGLVSGRRLDVVRITHERTFWSTPSIRWYHAVSFEGNPLVLHDAQLTRSQEQDEPR